MKRLICVVLALGVLGSLVGCQEDGLPQPAFPLEEDVVTAALEQTELPCTISEDETQSSAEDHILYTLRDPEDQALTIAISSALIEGERFLQINFLSPPIPNPPPFAWEEWKQQLVFAALLFGGFTDEEELYRAFSEKELSEGELKNLPQSVTNGTQISPLGIAGYAIICSTPKQQTVSPVRKSWSSPLVCM